MTIRIGGYSHTANAICGYRKTENHTFPYMLCEEKREGANASGYIIIEVPALTWTIFRSIESNGEPTSQISSLFKQFYNWLPNSGYDLAESPDMEIYYGGNGKLTAVEVWVAIKKK